MRSRSRPFVVVTFALCASLVGFGGAARAEDKKKSRRTTAEALKLKGLEMKKFVDIDTDGDGRKELIAVGANKGGNLCIVVVGEDKEGAVVTEQLPFAGGKEIAKLEGLPLAPPAASQEIVFEVYDETPDEKVKRVRVYGRKDDRLKEIFTSVLNRPKNAAERDSWENDKSIVSYGDARGGWYFGDLEDDGVGEVLVRRKPQIISIDKEDADPVRIMTGVREQVFRWDEANFAFKSAGERVNNFIPAMAIARVTASSAWVEPAVLKEMKANALNNALMKDGDGKDGDGKDSKEGKEGKEDSPGGELELGLEDLDLPPPKAPPKKPSTKKPPSSTKKPPKPAKEEEKEPEIEVDRSEWMQKGADNDLNTAWIEDAPDEGKGQWLEVELEEAAKIHMVRVVAGCVESAASFKGHNVPVSFNVSLDGGADALIDRSAPGTFDSPAIAFTGTFKPDPSKPWMKTTLVFFDGKTEAKKVRITLDKVVRQGKDNQTCISEVSVH